MHLEIIIGVLTAVTLLLLFLFVSVLLYSRRQKFLQSPTSRSLNPFPVQLNMKVRKKKSEKEGDIGFPNSRKGISRGRKSDNDDLP